MEYISRRLRSHCGYRHTARHLQDAYFGVPVA